ncbi:helix-turn-helix domain-containing protein [Shinella sp.]|uniref:helix-turn-helix domain-containing protein n=1 Tax=Shinella sp. TaxID=1870904 RepID=UPI002897D617|nr:helix-turn-helix domain-containing protein [Shinella sp.]
MLSQLNPFINTQEHILNSGKSRAGLFYRLDDMMKSKGNLTDYGRDTAIFHEGEPSRKLFKVVSGAVRICKFRDDGCRQIDTFCLPGDYFGFDLEDEARFAAETTTQSALLVASASAVMTPEAQMGGIAGAIWKLTVQDLHRSQNHALLLSYRNAEDRIVAFLEEMAVRLNRTSSIELPMSRQDIADYLGLTIETVSRAMTDLARHDAISLPRPRSVILNTAMRARLANASHHREPEALAKLAPALRPN